MADVKCHIFNEQTDIYFDDTENIIGYEPYILFNEGLEMHLKICNKVDEIYNTIKKLMYEQFTMLMSCELIHGDIDIYCVSDCQIERYEMTNEIINVTFYSGTYINDIINEKYKIMQYVLMDKTWIDTEAMNIVTDEQTINLLNMMK